MNRTLSNQITDEQQKLETVQEHYDDISACLDDATKAMNRIGITTKELGKIQYNLRKALHLIEVGFMDLEVYLGELNDYESDNT